VKTNTATPIFLVLKLKIKILNPLACVQYRKFSDAAVKTPSISLFHKELFKIGLKIFCRIYCTATSRNKLRKAPPDYE
jgi:hypothetical protein